MAVHSRGMPAETYTAKHFLILGLADIMETKAVFWRPQPVPRN